MRAVRGRVLSSPWQEFLVPVDPLWEFQRRWELSDGPLDA